MARCFYLKAQSQPVEICQNVLLYDILISAFDKIFMMTSWPNDVMFQLAYKVLQ